MSLIGTLKTFVAGRKAVASDVNYNFNLIRSVVNGGLGADNFAAGGIGAAGHGDLSATTSTLHSAQSIKITDSGSYYTSEDVEGALQEIAGGAGGNVGVPFEMLRFENDAATVEIELTRADCVSGSGVYIYTMDDALDPGDYVDVIIDVGFDYRAIPSSKGSYDLSTIQVTHALWGTYGPVYWQPPIVCSASSCDSGGEALTLDEVSNYILVRLYNPQWSGEQVHAVSMKFFWSIVAPKSTL